MFSKDLVKIRKEMKKDFYRQDYLDKFNLKSKTLNISAIIPTYNRCPFSRKSKNFLYNPLLLCVKSILMQKFPIKEIIIIDDNSNDYILEVLKYLKKLNLIDIKYIKNKKNKGSAISRNLGVKKAKGEYVLLLDDDCILAPYVSFISMHVFGKIKKKDDKIACLVLPPYNRSSEPKKILEMQYFKNRVFNLEKSFANFSSFPDSYFNNPDIFIDKKLKILKPIKTYQSWGYIFTDRQKYLEVKGFPEFFNWPNKAGEEVEFAERLIEKNYNLYYLPDPKVCSMHGSFGLKSSEKFTGFDWLLKFTDKKLSLREFCDLCESYGGKSGNRVSVEDFMYYRIISVFVLAFPRSIDSVKNWIDYIYENFVVKGDKKFFSHLYKSKNISYKKRLDIWKKAINNGMKLMKANKEFKKYLNEKYNFFVSFL